MRNLFAFITFSAAAFGVAARVAGRAGTAGTI
jgi:hypothetical protein